jgi:predicted phage baseplate assembly protein
VLATPDQDAAVLADLAAHDPSQTVLEWLSGHGVTMRQPPVVRGGDGEWSISDGSEVVRVRVDGDTLVLLGRPVAATGITEATPRLAQPQIALTGGGSDWSVRWDLLASGADARDFAVETEHDGTSYLRFGDGGEGDGHGRRPEAGTSFTARYRVGNGVGGNVGAGTLTHIATTAAVTAVTNPLPAAGGHEPETADEVRRDAPQAYLIQERAVTAPDWEEVATRDAAVQRAAATWRWTGSWHTVFLTVDRLAGAEVDESFETGQRARLERYRLAGYDLELDGPHYVPLELALFVCVEPGHLRSAVRREVLAALTALFGPDRLTFAQPVYLSPVYAAAQSVRGVTSVEVTTFRRQHDPAVSGIGSGVLPMGRLEIARLDNNPNFPEHGVLTLTLGGGR